MKSSFAELLNPDTDLVPLLEACLVGPGLPELIALLEIQHAGKASDSSNLETLLGGELDQILQNGLGALPRNRLHELLIHPKLWPDLRDKVFDDGGAYWERYFGDPLTEKAAKNFAAQISRPKQSRWSVGVTFALAASLLIGLFGWQSGWFGRAATGWQSPQALLASDTPSLLKQLATLAETYRVPADADEARVRKTATEMAVGCRRIISEISTGPPTYLAVADRDWLLERCRAWQGAIDRATTPDQLNALIDRLEKVLSQRAEGKS